jgi:hypothetical protein
VRGQGNASSSLAHRLPVRAAQLSVAAAFAWLLGVWLTHRVVGGDTPWLVDGTDALAACLSRHELSGCGFTGELSPAGQMSAVGPYPLMQYVPDYVARSLGATHDSRYTLLALLSAVAVVVSLLLAWLVLSRIGQPAWFWGFVIIVLCGPVLVYGNTTWGELLAAALLTCLVAAAVLGTSPPIVGAAAFVACLTKETSYPFVAALGLLGLVLMRRRSGQPIRSHVICVAAGVAIAIVCASLFNVARFGSVTNTNYLRPEFRSPLMRIPEFAVGLLVAPNGGILIFWTSATVLLAALVLVPFLTKGRGEEARFDRAVALALAGIAISLTLALASWWAPFGWAAWGPRLSLPWVLPLVLLGLAAFGRPLGAVVLRLLARGWRLLLVAVALITAALPHIGYIWRPEAATVFFNLSLHNPHCTAPGPLGSSQYYTCLHEEMWWRRSIMNEALRGLGEAGGVVTAALVAPALLGCLVLLREGLRATPPQAGVAPTGRRSPV